MSDKTPFERSIQESLQNYQAPYDPSQWAGIEAELDRMEASSQGSRKNGRKTTKWAALATGGVAVIVGAAFLFNDIDPGSKDATKDENNAVIADQSKDQETQEDRGTRTDKTDKTKGEKGETSSNSSNSPNTKADAPADQEATGQEHAGDTPEKKKASSTTDVENEKKEGKLEVVTADVPEPSVPKNPLPEDIGIQADQQEGCQGLKVRFHTSQNIENADHFWDLGDGSYSNKEAPVHHYENAGKHDITLTLTDPESGKTRRVVKEDFITVHQGPSAKIEEISKEQRMRKSPRPTTIFRLSERRDIDKVVWRMGDGTRLEGKTRVEHRYSSKGLYKVRVYLTGDNGCRDTLRHLYKQNKSFDLLAPNAFTPDGDGVNDQFIPKALKILDRPFTLTIHDRSGRVVYKTHDASEPWNGRIQNSGEFVDHNSAFLWIVVLQNENGEEETYKGQVTVLR